MHSVPTAHLLDSSGSFLLTPLLLCRASCSVCANTSMELQRGKLFPFLALLRGHRAEQSTVVIWELGHAAGITSMEGRSGFGSMKVGRGKSGFIMHGVSSVPLLEMASLDWVTVELFLDRNGWLEWNQRENVCNRTKQEGCKVFLFVHFLVGRNKIHSKKDNSNQ